MSSPSRSRRSWIVYCVLTLVFVAGVWFFGFRTPPPDANASMKGSFRKKGNTMPVPVRALPAERRNLDVYLKAIGTVAPLNIVTVRSRVEGQLLRVAFEEGQQVEKGQLLAEIDPTPYRIRLAQAEGQQRQNISQVQTAKSDLERFRQLNAQALVTAQQLEQQEALVAEREGALAADKAMVDEARLQLAYTRIEAPISGRAGLRAVDVGNLVRANDANGLVIITQTRPISVMFTVPEIDLAKVVEPLRAGEQLTVEAWDRSEQTRLAIGVLKTFDNQIDIATGTLRLKAEFPNNDEKLFPNQFVNIRLRVRTLNDAIVIPVAAVQFGSRGTYVYVVNGQSQSTVRDIVLGPSDGTYQSVVQGLTPGDQVILEGLDRLREGRLVTVVSDNPAAGVASGGPDSASKGKGGSGVKGRGKGRDVPAATVK
jgi:multidrug efflux system membrane fusion protein